MKPFYSSFGTHTLPLVQCSSVMDWCAQLNGSQNESVWSSSTYFRMKSYCEADCSILKLYIAKHAGKKKGGKIHMRIHFIQNEKWNLHLFHLTTRPTIFTCGMVQFCVPDYRISYFSSNVCSARAAWLTLREVMATVTCRGTNRMNWSEGVRWHVSKNWQPLLNRVGVHLLIVSWIWIIRTKGIKLVIDFEKKIWYSKWVKTIKCPLVCFNVWKFKI